MRSPVRSLLVIALLAGCKPKPPPDLAELAKRLDYKSTPVVPSPDSGTYYPSPIPNRDPVIERLLRGKGHDAALSGAAGAIALAAVEERGDLSRWELREALWRAGWPYNAFDARRWNTREGDPPPGDLLDWIEALPADQPVGLVRARGRGVDVWVGIRSQPLVELPPIPRRAPMGSTVNLPVVPGARFRLSDAGGRLTEGDLDAPVSLLLASAGEWMLQLVEGRRELASLPIYVDLAPPTEPLLRTPTPPGPIVGAPDADARTRHLLRHVREAYALPAWVGSPLLDAAARELAGSMERGAARAVAAVGLQARSLTTWTCDDVTVENCLDTWAWDPRRRDVLLSPDADTFGLHTVLDARGLHLTMIVADIE